jgi:hypothetical protein
MWPASSRFQAHGLWKATHGGMDVSEAEEVKHLRDENARLEKLVADLSLDKHMLQSVIRKNSLGFYPGNVDLLPGTPSWHEGQKVRRLRQEFSASERRVSTPWTKCRPWGARSAS